MLKPTYQTYKVTHFSDIHVSDEKNNDILEHKQNKIKLFHKGNAYIQTRKLNITYKK